MSGKKNDKPTQTQSEAFMAKARELGCDGDQDTFDRLLKKVGSAPPPKTVQQRKAPKKEKR